MQRPAQSPLALPARFPGSWGPDVRDGLQVLSGEVSKVESSRFRLGTIDTTLSTADSTGRYTTKVYDTAEVTTMLDDIRLPLSMCTSGQQD